MNKEEFFARFDKKTQEILKQGFCTINGKSYYCMTNNGSYNHAFTNYDSYTYYVFLKAFNEIAKSIGADMIHPEFVNARCKSGFIKGDIIVEDFSNGEEKIKVIDIEANDYIEGNFAFYGDITFEDQMNQMKKVSEYYSNPRIYQMFLKHFLFHLYLGDVDFNFENIEIFKSKNGDTRVSPMFDFGGVYYMNVDEIGDGSWGYNFNQVHLAPNFLKYELVDYIIKEQNEVFSLEDIEKDFYIKPSVMTKRKIHIMNTQDKDKKKLIIRAINDLEDKSFLDKLLNIDIDECLEDELFTDNLKSLIKVGITPYRKAIKTCYEEYLKKLPNRVRK